MPRSRNPGLTARQERVLDLLARGLTNPEIASVLGITLDGAKYHVSEIFDKLGVDSREQAVAAWRDRRPNAFHRLRALLFTGWSAATVVGLTAAAVVTIMWARPAAAPSGHVAAPPSTAARDSPTTLPPTVVADGEETFAPVGLAVGNQAVEVRGHGSDDATLIEVALPPGVVLPDAPSLVVDGAPVPLVDPINSTDRVLEARFAPTPPGSAVTVNLGTFAADPNVPSVWATVDVAKVFGRAGGGAGALGTFDLEHGDLLDGPADFVTAVEQDEDATSIGHRQWVGLVVTGAWHPETDASGAIHAPALFDQEGNELTITHVQVGYTRDDSGIQLPDTTSIAGFVDDPSKVESLRVVLGPPVGITSLDRSIELHPAH